MMPSFARIVTLGTLLLATPALSGCAAMAVKQKEDNLAAAGFVVRPANTPDRIAMLKRLPPHHFVRREHGNVVHFVYADPLVCGCLYVGDQKAYDQYKRDRMQQQLVDEQAMTADTYADAAWNWNGWGPWDARWGFTYGPGIGW
jgi:hypothetical protein